MSDDKYSDRALAQAVRKLMEAPFKPYTGGLYIQEADLLALAAEIDAAEPQPSAITQSLIDMLVQRDRHGRAKYGTTLDRSDLSLANWLQHMAEELLDGAGYALAAKREIAQAGVPDGYVLMPRRLTAENGAKAALIGEFSVDVVHTCPDCADADGYDEDGSVCETCTGEAVVHETQPIPWDTIARIHERVVELFAAAPKPQEPQS